MRALLKSMGDALVDEVGPDVIFAVFIEWRDGRPMSYLSNGDRPDMVRAFTEWLGRTESTGGFGPSLGAARCEPSPLEARCAHLGKEMVEEDIDVVLFLFTVGPGGEAAWFCSLDGGRELVKKWVQSERSLS